MVIILLWMVGLLPQEIALACSEKKNVFFLFCYTKSYLVNERMWCLDLTEEELVLEIGRAHV